MKNIYNKNGLIFWTEKDILLKKYFEDIITIELKEFLLKINSAFRFVKCDAPLFIPNEYINKNYNEEYIYKQNNTDISLRPETTAGSYEYAKKILNNYNDIRYKLPLVVYQHNKSFRREQDKTFCNMRLKEFYQLEYQVIFSDTTKNDYFDPIVNFINDIITKYIWSSYVDNSDRLPVYSKETKDIICNEVMLEVCSISRRLDFSIPNTNVIEVAIGTDRLVYLKNNQ
jgi:glycyl-tRNA synthetase (class II)